MSRTFSTKAYLALALGLLFVVLSVVVIVLVNSTMKRLALIDAEHAARMLLDHNLAVHMYFSKDLKPKLFDKLGPTTSKDYFEPVWMSSTYAVRKMDEYFRHFNPNPYYYKECAINARSPENEADNYEKGFLVDLQENRRWTTKSAIRVLEGKPFFTVLRRGEAMEESCLRCHSTPEKAPGDMVKYYGPERSFHRKVDEVAQAISIRIPLSEAFSSATRFSYYLSGLLLVALGSGFLFVWVGNKRLLLSPMAEIQEHAVRIASGRESLGETVPEPRIRELRDLVAAFNQMSAELKKTYEEQEQRILERTQELATANRKLEKEIQDRLKAAQALRVSEAKYRAVFDNAGIGIDLIDGDGKILQVNQALLDMLGYDQEELRQLTFQDITHPDDKGISQRNLEALMEGEIDSYRLEKRYLRKDGTVLWGNLTTSAIRDANGSHTGSVGLIEDITDRKKAEEEREQLRNQLFQAQKMEAIGTLTGGIAHDFNNLLTIINGYTELVLSEKTSEDPCYSDLQKVLDTGRKGAELVQRLLALSKKGESNPQPLDLNRTVENAVALMKRTFPKMIGIETILAENLNMVNADASQVEQALMNLCINAKEAMPLGGKLTIETKNESVVEADCKFQVTAKPGPHVVIEVKDTGEGMDAETLDRLFDPFFTTKGWDFKKGTGLSLPVAKGIVEQHGGWITCASERGKGTTFRIYFPAIEGSPAAEKDEARPATAPQMGSILLVDDEDLVRDLGKRILERAGYEVITASDGKEALDIYARDHTKIGLVVLDLIMPQMSGEQCLGELLKINPHVKVIVSSGHSLAQKDQDRLGSLAKGFVNKPYDIRQLLEVVRAVLDGE